MGNEKKNRIEKSSFFREISLEYRATKLPYDYKERKESQTSLTDICLVKYVKLSISRLILVKSANGQLLHNNIRLYHNREILYLISLRKFENFR